MVSLCFAGEALCAAALVWAAATGILTVLVLLGVAFLFGIARAFRSPAAVALAPMLVPAELLPRAIAWNSLAFQIGAISGPALAGYLVGSWSSTHSYSVSLALYLAPIVGLAFIRHPTRPAPHFGSRIDRVKEGLSYIWANKVVLGAISLDLCAVPLRRRDRPASRLRANRPTVRPGDRCSVRWGVVARRNGNVGAPLSGSAARRPTGVGRRYICAPTTDTMYQRTRASPHT